MRESPLKDGSIELLTHDTARIVVGYLTGEPTPEELRKLRRFAPHPITGEENEERKEAITDRNNLNIATSVTSTLSSSGPEMSSGSRSAQ